LRMVRFRDVVAAVWLLETSPVENVKVLLDMLNEVADGCEVQLFNPDILVDWEHFDAALVSAVMSFMSGGGSARKLGIEFLTKLAATDQVSKAISFAGVSDGCKRLGVLILGRDMEHVKRQSIRVNQLLGGLPINFETSPDRVERIARYYNVEAGPHIQARDRSEALKLAIIQKIATSIL